jgi:hypothetical protein
LQYIWLCATAIGGADATGVNEKMRRSNFAGTALAPLITLLKHNRIASSALLFAMWLCLKMYYTL